MCQALFQVVTFSHHQRPVAEAAIVSLLHRYRDRAPKGGRVSAQVHPTTYGAFLLHVEGYGVSTMCQTPLKGCYILLLTQSSLQKWSVDARITVWT